jgi:glycine cleavage system aminomethyltransferase T
VIERALAAMAPRLHCEVVDVTSMFAMIAVMGPQLARADAGGVDRRLLQRGVSRSAPRARSIWATRPCAPRASPTSANLGWELYVPVEFAVGVYEALREAGRAFGVANAGYYAIDSLRLEKGYRAWGRELSPDINPYEAGLGSPSTGRKPAAFADSAALAAARRETRR